MGTFNCKIRDKSALQKFSGSADQYNYTIMEDEKEFRDDIERSC
jgi:hypothetical protein